MSNFRTRYDGGRPVTHYVIEQKGKFDLDFIEVLKTEDDGLEAVVDGLREKAIFQWRVRAVNKAGPSLPCDPTDKHVVKHRHSELMDEDMKFSSIHLPLYARNQVEMCFIPGTEDSF